MTESLPEELTAEAVAAAVGRVPGVRLHEQSVVGTHLAGRRIAGVRVHGRDVEVHVATIWPTTVQDAAAAVRAALAPLPVDKVDVAIDDVVLPGDDNDDDSPEGTTPEVTS